MEYANKNMSGVRNLRFQTPDIGNALISPMILYPYKT